MVSLTTNEAMVIEFLVRNFDNNYNINQIARKLKLSPRGSFKILKKLEAQNILKSQKIGNGIFYEINFNSDLAINLCRLVLLKKKTTPILNVIIKDIEKLKKITQCAIIFGSILKKGKNANDIDVLLVFNKNQFRKVQKLIDEINQLTPKKVHPIIQTKTDLIKNIKKRDKIILNGIKEGTVIWGEDILVQAIKVNK